VTETLNKDYKIGMSITPTGTAHMVHLSLMVPGALMIEEPVPPSLELPECETLSLFW
jgi:hypothetical protein